MVWLQVLKQHKAMQAAAANMGVTPIPIISAAQRRASVVAQTAAAAKLAKQVYKTLIAVLAMLCCALFAMLCTLCQFKCD